MKTIRYRKVLKANGMLVRRRGKHLCMEGRGVRIFARTQGRIPTGIHAYNSFKRTMGSPEMAAVIDASAGLSNLFKNTREERSTTC